MPNPHHINESYGGLFLWCLRVQTYVLKLAKSGEDGEKVFLLLESGARFHTTEVNTMLWPKRLGHI